MINNNIPEKRNPVVAIVRLHRIPGFQMAFGRGHLHSKHLSDSGLSNLEYS